MTSTGTTTAAPLSTLERHGQDLHALARLLTSDPELAERLVVLAVRTSAPDDGLRRLGAVIVRAWRDGRPDELHTIAPAVPTTLDAVHEMPAQQRAALALCRFGGHTYREAAALLGVPAAGVAEMLTSSLRTLQSAPPAPDADGFTQRAV